MTWIIIFITRHLHKIVKLDQKRHKTHKYLFIIFGQQYNGQRTLHGLQNQIGTLCSQCIENMLGIQILFASSVCETTVRKFNFIMAVYQTQRCKVEVQHIFLHWQHRVHFYIPIWFWILVRSLKWPWYMVPVYRPSERSETKMLKHSLFTLASIWICI